MTTASTVYRWISRALLTAAFVALIGAALYMVWGHRGLMELQALKARENRIKQDISEIILRSERIELEIRRLKTDPDTIEHIARHELGLTRPDELIIQFSGNGDRRDPVAGIRKGEAEPKAETGRGGPD